MSDEPDRMTSESRLKAIHDELRTIRKLVSEGLFALREAQAEVPEKMRRFITYMHDLHDVCYIYESRGQPVPPYILREMERCDDRYRQLLDEQHEVGGAFEKVRTEMAKDKNNRWDHTRLLSAPKPKEAP